MVCERLRLGLGSGLGWKKLSRVNGNFEIQTFPESLRLLSERSKPPLRPPAQPPSPRLASQPRCASGGKGEAAGASSSPRNPAWTWQGLFAPGPRRKWNPRGRWSTFLILFLAKARLSPGLRTPAFPRVKGSLDVRRSPVAFC